MIHLARSAAPSRGLAAVCLAGLAATGAVGVLYGASVSARAADSRPGRQSGASLADAPAAPLGGAAAPEARRTPTPLCEITHDKRAGPPLVALGDTIEVTLTTRARCSVLPHYVHIVLVMDESDAMAGQAIRQTKDAAQRLVDDLELAYFPSTYVGVVGFADRARRLGGLSNDPDLVRRAIHRVQAGSGGSRMDLGLQEALRVHQRGEADRDPDRTTEIVIAYSVGPPNDRCEEALRASRQVRGAGILTIAICAGSSCHERCMRDIASAPRYFFHVEDGHHGLMGVMHQIRDRLYNVVVRGLVISDTLASDLSYVPGSARPEPTAIGRSGRWLQWYDVYIPRDGVTHTFRAKPLRLGAMTTNERAVGEAISSTGERHAWQFTVPTVVVVEPSPTHTPKPTATRTPQYVPVTPPGRSPTAVATWVLYVPAVADGS